MEQPSVTYSATQSVDKWTDTDVISSYKEICKQFDIVQEKLREEVEQKEEKFFTFQITILKGCQTSTTISTWKNGTTIAYTVKWTDTDVISYYKENMRKRTQKYI
ncbi:unnamed protein product [Rhizophagus irregularis]|uniref:Uncharacterized protein n=1 Tax=Rhizophagus irregularis TaxID=588596 RepID=A0A2N1MZ95_9GLOM|nr:hypothetical protein RhiirC2_784137 [Rhizophagus irregularis]CAB4383414.1 unnamed protein product [Rhizophagus irregularis]CAB5363642.1 unnamed protein product [Rhizophagus irregularis]